MLSSVIVPLLMLNRIAYFDCQRFLNEPVTRRQHNRSAALICILKQRFQFLSWPVEAIMPPLYLEWFQRIGLSQQLQSDPFIPAG